MSRLIQKLQEAFGDEPDFVAYGINYTTVTLGTPPAPIKGLEYIAASHRAPQNNLIMSMNGRGVFAGNRNKSGLIELALMPDSPSVGVIQAFMLAGIPVPIFATDSSTSGTSTFFAPACKPIKTPEWRRAATPGLTVYRFQAETLYITHGIRKLNN